MNRIQSTATEWEFTARAGRHPPGRGPGCNPQPPLPPLAYSHCAPPLSRRWDDTGARRALAAALRGVARAVDEAGGGQGAGGAGAGEGAGGGGEMALLDPRVDFKIADVATVQRLMARAALQVGSGKGRRLGKARRGGGHEVLVTGEAGGCGCGHRAAQHGAGRAAVGGAKGCAKRWQGLAGASKCKACTPTRLRNVHAYPRYSMVSSSPLPSSLSCILFAPTTNLVWHSCAPS